MKVNLNKQPWRLSRSKLEVKSSHALPVANREIPNKDKKTPKALWLWGFTWWTIQDLNL